MKSPKLRIVFVEEDAQDIDEVKSILEVTKYFDIIVRENYGAVSDEDLVEADLFILDVYTEESDVPFYKFVQRLHKYGRPFIAYTNKSEHSRVEVDPNLRPPLRRFVLQNGGLGMVAKQPTRNDEARISRSDLGYDLGDRIMSFYWSWRQVPR